MKKAASVDDYMEGVPEPARKLLQKVRATIRSAAPKEATEAIRWGMPTFQYRGQLVGYAAFKNHCSLFPMSLAVMDTFKLELQSFTAAKGTIHFTHHTPMPTPLLKKIVKARVEENDAKKKRRA